MSTIDLDGGAGAQASLQEMNPGAEADLAELNPPGCSIAALPELLAQISPSSWERQQLQERTLTVRERAVLRLIGEGLSGKRIARDLNITPETVKSHTKHIFSKLGTQTRAQSVAYAVRLGII